MKETPILFSGQMVSAIIEDRKTQTRRALRLQPPADATNPRITPDGWRWWCQARAWPGPSKTKATNFVQCPYGQPGDRLWVRENFQVCSKCSTLNFAANVNKPKNCSGCDEYLGRWKPSIHMPRTASRIILELVSVRVERLQEITEEDAKAEGAELTQTVRGLKSWAASYRAAYWSLWNSINARRNGGQFSWDKNPWVFALTFKKVEK